MRCSLALHIEISRTVFELTASAMEDVLLNVEKSNFGI